MTELPPAAAERPIYSYWTVETIRPLLCLGINTDSRTPNVLKLEPREGWEIQLNELGVMVSRVGPWRNQACATVIGWANVAHVTHFQTERRLDPGTW